MNPWGRRFDALTWPAARQAMQRPGATVIWPFGACEQHGPQLPLATDALFAERILDAVLRGLAPDDPVWRLPVQAIGFSPEHQAFPGTLTLTAELLLQLVDQVVCLFNPPSSLKIIKKMLPMLLVFMDKSV